MAQEKWTEVDEYFTHSLTKADPVLDACLAANARGGLPAIDVSPLQGKFLQLIAQIQGARTILEIGTLGGYSTIWLARALPPDGRMITLESNPKHADVARANISRARLDARVELILGSASESLARLEREHRGPFDLIFIDADKPSNPEYLTWALKLSRPGTIIIGDNVVRSGMVVDAESADANVQGIRKFIDLIAAEPRLSANAVQTVGVKGHDGFAIARVVG